MMYNLTEKVSLSRFFLYQLTKPFSFFNEAISFICLIEGNVAISTPSREYQMHTGDIFLMKREENFLFIPNEPSLFLSVHFDYLFFREDFADDFPFLHCNSMRETDKNYPKLLSSLAELAFTHISDTNKNRFLIRHQIYSLFHLLKAEYVTYPAGHTEESKQEQKIRQFIQFMKEHCTESPSLQDTADYLGYTPQYLSSFIKKNLHCTYNAYLNDARLEKALLLIKYRDISPLKVAVNCGFTNYSRFEKSFREKYRVTPEEYRMDFQKRLHCNREKLDTIREPSIIKDKLLNLVHFVEEEPEVIVTPEKEHHTFDASHTQPIEKNWDKIINLGHALNFEKPKFRQHVIQLQNQFHFTYGRFGGILQLVGIFYGESDSDNQEQLSFNFSRAFQPIDFLLENGIKPHFDFGGKPFDIYLMNDPETDQSLRHYLNYLELILKDFLCACINRYGFDEVSTWNFEYWMHYNSFLTKIDSTEEFFRHFSFFYATIKELLPEAKVGAPGFNLFLSIDILQSTLEILQKNQMIPDFISVLFYPYAKPDDHGHETELHIKLSQDPNLLYKKIDEVYALFDQMHIPDTQLYVTEYSTFVSPMNFINDSIYQGTFLLKQTLDNLGHVPVLAYWLATDYSMSYPDSAELLFGGNGLLTKDGIEKPGFHAYRSLSNLGMQLIGKGEHFIITRSSII